MNSYKFILLCTVLVVGCATPPTPSVLVNARKAYQDAQTDDNASLVTGELFEAKEALKSAERSFLEEPESQRTLTLAYVAHRQAELAVAKAGIKAATAQRKKAWSDLQDLLYERLKLVRGKLDETQRALEEERKKLKDTQRRLEEALRKVAEAAALAVKQEDRGTVIVLPGNVLFKSGKWDLIPLAVEKLSVLAETLKDQPDVNITVEGHTDSRGSASSNMVLSQRRADAVTNLLISRGVDPTRIRAVGMGQSRPIADNSTTEGRANNRRVEIIVKAGEPR